MSFNRLSYDSGAYSQNINESVGPGVYKLGEPGVACPKQCYPYPPSIRLQKQGVSIDKTKFLIDVDSELNGLFKKYTKDPSKNYVPCCPDTVCTSGELCGQGVAGACKNNKGLKRGERYPDNDLHHFQDCFIPVEHTRISNPTCNLRGTGWNRWEWLCLDPQERTEIPFDFNISNRIVVKDNHRPCVPKPVDPTLALPKGGNLPCANTNPTCGVYTDAPSVNWRNCNQIREY